MLGLLYWAGRSKGAAQIEKAAAGAVVTGRALARSSARSVMLGDLAALGATPGGARALLDMVASDAARALRAARSVAERAAQLARDGLTDEGARVALTPKLELVAATESAEAYNAERAAIAAGAGSVTSILKVWDAELDRRTCSVCSGLDGTIIGLGEAFPLEQPVHPRCRCTFTLLRSDEQPGEIEIRAIAAR